MRKSTIKIDANRRFRMNDFGKLDCGEILDELYRDGTFKKKVQNVCNTIENALYKNHQVTGIIYDILLSELIVEYEDLDYNTCPKCLGEIGEHPAISREDNKTRICSECGTKEALSAFAAYMQDKE